MTANELRIGNWIIDGHDIEQVTADHIKCAEEGRCEFDPIELTEEWLIKFGFEFVENITQWANGPQDLSYYQIQQFPRLDFKIFLDFSSNYYKGEDGTIKYVHQLQNLYFALTGNELTINEL